MLNSDHRGQRDMQQGREEQVRIAELRRGRGWSQQRLLAELTQLAQQRGRALPTRTSLRVMLSRWENGHNVPDAESRELLSAALGCDEYDLGVGESGAPIEGLEPTPTTRYSASITPETLTIYETLLQQYASLDALVGPAAAIGPVREQLRTLEGLLPQASCNLRSSIVKLAARYAELAGWLAQDSGDSTAAASWSAKAADLSAEAGDVQLSSYIWARRSNIASEAGHAAEALLLADGALASADQLPADLLAVGLRQQGHAHALLGDERAAGRAMDAALDTATHATEMSGIAVYCTPAYVQSEAAAAWTRLGRPDRATALLDDALLRWPPEQARDRAIGLARLARAYLLAGEVEHACALGHDAIASVQNAMSARALDQLAQLRTSLRPMRGQRTAAEVSDRLRQILR